MYLERNLETVGFMGLDVDAPTIRVCADSSDGSAVNGLSVSALLPGEIVFGDYRVEALVGCGAMGCVYRARNIMLDEVRAIKILHPDQHSGRSSWLIREAKALAKIQHDAVVRYIELLSDQGGRRLGLVMEYVDGMSLSQRMSQSPLAPSEVISLAHRLGSGLDESHRRGVVHLDLSPDNIILPDGRPDRAKIIDFGISRNVDDDDLNCVTGFTGKLRYASPEQLSAEEPIGQSSDAYSLGLVLTAASIGRDFERSATYDEALRDRRGLKSLPKSLPRKLRRKLEALVARDPSRRPSALVKHFTAR